jgi:hypothetical protein
MKILALDQLLWTDKIYINKLNSILMTRAKLASTMIDELLISAPQVLRGANT